MYLPDTNVLVTRFFADVGMAEVIDFMPVGREAGGQTEQASRQVVRIAKSIRGAIPFRMECRPAFDYARQPHEIHLDGDGRAAIFASPRQQFVLKSARPLRAQRDGRRRRIHSGEQPGGDVRAPASRRDGRPVARIARRSTARHCCTETVRYWRAGPGAAATAAAGARPSPARRWCSSC